MKISEKIEHKNLNEINIYLEGVFWIAYEQSAYYFWKLKGYKPTKKFVKVIGKEVVSVGFPEKVLEEILTTPSAFGVHPFNKLKGNMAANETHVVFEITEAIDEEAFLEWKTKLSDNVGARRALPLRDNPQLSVIDKIKNFDMSNKTPMECMFFLAEIKKSLIINN